MTYPGATMSDPTSVEPPAEDSPEPDTTPSGGRRWNRTVSGLVTATLTLALGFGLVVQIRSTGEAEERIGATEQDLVRILDDLDAREEQLRGQLAERERAVEELSDGRSQSGSALAEAQRRAEAKGTTSDPRPPRSCDGHRPDGGRGLMTLTPAGRYVAACLTVLLALVGVAVMFTLAILPILAFVGVAIDYTRANNARSSMQAALDSTALMLSKDLTMGNITAAQIPSKAQAYFNGLYTNKDGQGIAVSATYTTPTSNAAATILLSGSGHVKTTLDRKSVV